MSFRIKINPGAYEVTAEEGESIIDATLRQGLLLPYGCRCASCGACKGKVLTGEFKRSDGDPDLLSEEEMAAGYTLFCHASAQSDMEIEVEEVILTGDVEVKMMPGRVAKMHKLAPDVMELQVRIPENQKLLFFAGQYLNFQLQDGRHRSYSLANAPHDDDLIELHIRIVSGGYFSAQVLNQISEIILENKGYLIFTDLPLSLPNGRNIESFFQQMKITGDSEHVKVFPRRDEAQVWVEEQVLGIKSQAVEDESLLDLHEMELLKDRKPETVAALKACLETRSYKAGEKIYSVGERGDQLFMIRRGAVQMMLPSEGTTGHHLATYGRGDFFGGLSFLDGQRRGNEAISQTDTELFVLRREAFDQLKEQHRQFAQNLIEAIARVLSMRLRYDDMELAALRD